MPALQWGTVGERYFESGVDRGVLYPEVGNGVAWNGLVGVSESPSGGGPRPFYLDGFKYVNLAEAEEFEASISAYSSPEEFKRCDGTFSLHNGLFVTQQPRESFGFSYRTRIGNDVDNLDHGYKIHLVYNALAAPSSRPNSTLNASTTPIVFQWNITTAPVEAVGFKPSAHFVIDSRHTPYYYLSAVERILYGYSAGNSRLPTVDELVELFNTPPDTGIFTELFEELF